jgi:DNA-binding CsgD family transcriptional regulator
MSIWHRFLYLIGLRPTPGPRTYEISESLQVTLSTLAAHEGRPEPELILDLLAAGLTHYRDLEERWRAWDSLTVREKQVAALVCLGYANRQIAARLVLSEATVKFHSRHLLKKFDVRNRAQLRQVLANWDFHGWDDFPSAG